MTTTRGCPQQNEVLITIYSIVLLGGAVGAFMMSWCLLKSKSKSVMTISVFNLLAVHSIFLLTIPFRISYYIYDEWHYGLLFCKLVSAMLHAHMYISVLFYVWILVLRFHRFLKKGKKVKFQRTLSAVLASAAVWIIVSLVIFPVVLSQYGNSQYNETKCFQFQAELKKKFVVVVNYIFCILVMSVVCVLASVQLVIILKVVNKFQDAFSQQEFRAQMKNLFFLLIMFVCFLPCHAYKIYFMQYTEDDCSTSKLYFYNEVCLSLTAVCCFDLLIFLAGGAH
nr:PREDICTED: probable G-protein coupled receptor 141 [Latimeria chalumnae]|eukprot:XP_006011863.2 PREDICTED: probable G-protein coupled receptor 141 [Latimeria chalumnae]